MTSASTLMAELRNLHDVRGYQDLNWEGSFEEYLEIARRNPKVVRSAFQRVYDMIVAQGTEEYKEYKKKIIRYKFFEDPFENGKDGVFGLDLHLMKLVHLFKSAAKRYGAEKRIFLLHGPVGSSKSTIARLLKKGVEHYSRTPEGALYTFKWVKHPSVDAQVASSQNRLRRRASAGTDFGTPCAENTTGAPSGTWSSSSTNTAPRRSRLWTT